MLSVVMLNVVAPKIALFKPKMKTGDGTMFDDIDISRTKTPILSKQLNVEKIQPCGKKTHILNFNLALDFENW